jgi:hypothetical protein
MKNSIIGFLAICVIVVLSFMYKASHSPILGKFPVENELKNIPTDELPLLIYIFFSRHNCPNCLEAIHVLNELPPPFFVTGIVPGEELKNEDELRKTTGAAFNLVGFNESYKKFTPHYMPTVFGVGRDGQILFILPGIPGEKKYLHEFLINFYGKSLELLITDE